MTEKDIKGYEGLYTISEDGVIRSVETGRQRKINYNYRYPQIGLNKSGEKSLHRVHRLLAEAFIPNPEGKPYVNHIDGDKHNNSLDNLEWVTASENCKHAYENGLSKPPNPPTQRLSEKDVVMTRDLYDAGMFQPMIAKLFGVHPSTISNIITRTTHAGI